MQKFLKKLPRWGLSWVYRIIRSLYALFDLFNPLFYFSSLRIKGQIQGDLKFKNKKTVIFVLYQNDKIPFYVQNVLDVLQKLEVNCVLNINDQFSQKNIEKLKKQSSKILVRRNFGFDFAAYKDTIHRLDLKGQERLVLMNDTMFYFKKDLDKLFIQFFDDAYDVVAFSQNNFCVEGAHLQSFLLSFGNRVIEDLSFIKYWKKYRSFNSRYYVIDRGEVGFSTKVLSKYYESTRVIFNSEFLAKRLKTISQQIRQFFSNTITCVAKEGVVNFGEKVLDERKVFRCLQETNKTHSAAFVIAHCGEGVAIKRDLVYRGILSIEQVQKNLEKLDLDLAEINQAIKEMELKGYYLQEPSKVRLLKSAGVR